MARAKIAHREEARLAAESRPEEDEEDDVPAPPDGGYGWVIVFASFMCNLVVDGISYCFGIFLIELINYYHESKGTTAWVGSILAGATMCPGPIISIIANKYGCRLCCIMGSIIAATAFALSIYCPNVQSLMLVYGFMGGLGFGFMYLPAVVCVGYYFDTKRSLATGIAVCGSGVGTFAIAPVAQYLIDNFGWKGTNLVFAGVIGTCVLFGALMKPLEYKQKPPKQVNGTAKPNLSRRNTYGDTTSPYASKLSIASRRSHTVKPMERKDVFYSQSVLNLKEFQSQKSLNEYRRHSLASAKPKNSSNELLMLFKDPVFMLIGISNLFGMAALYVPFVYIVECAVTDGISKGKASFLISIIGITNTIGRLLVGYLADFPQINALLVNNLALVLAAIAVGLAPFCHTYAAYVAMSIAFALAIAAYISLTSIILVDLLGLDKLTNAFGLLILFRGTASVIGSPLAGALYDITHSFTVPFFVAGGLFAIAAAISFSVPPVKACLDRRKKVSSNNDEAMTPMNTKQNSNIEEK
ncbi:unnamed protein product [Acanthoscelides obtectus]|uniref:Major facilitator superfamily (MFS) profile domain-containing protein n=1 Tax=Acanthoscelides obtectus TaxID=200917 RepID=A0A9P0LWU2_ACAOB|nr:unnamed protein product [Acanthoscelides obtectus]CAK1621388.1 Monocarboxylate transporter 14 [Acanthoscelides obtectus]